MTTQGARGAWQAPEAPQELAVLAESAALPAAVVLAESAVLGALQGPGALAGPESCSTLTLLGSPTDHQRRGLRSPRDLQRQLAEQALVALVP